MKRCGFRTSQAYIVPRKYKTKQGYVLLFMLLKYVRLSGVHLLIFVHNVYAFVLCVKLLERRYLIIVIVYINFHTACKRYQRTELSKTHPINLAKMTED